MINVHFGYLILTLALFKSVQSGKESIGRAIQNLWHNSSKFTTEKARLKLASHKLEDFKIADAIDGYRTFHLSF